MTPLAARLLYWPPRIFSIAFAVFISIFALDVFDRSQGLWRILLALCIHLIPTAAILAVLIAAWRWEWIGACLFAGLAGVYAWSVLPRHLDWAAYISGPLLVIALWFLADWAQRRKVKAAL